MRKSDLWRILIATFLAFCALYSPQPTLPLLANEFGLSPADASLLITITLMPLGLAPIFYGYLIEAIPARTVLRYAILALAFGQLLFAIADSYALLLLSRLLQGLCFPAIFTALMTYCASMTENRDIKRVMGFYIASTILGGFAGRAISGAIASITDWHYTYGLFTLLLLAVWYALRDLQSDAELDFARLDLNAIKNTFHQPHYRYGFLIIFCTFFCFASLLNALPFHLIQLDPAISEFTLSLVYGGYMIGIVIALNSMQITHWLGSEARSIQLGAWLFLAAVASFMSTTTTFAIASMFLLAAGMFLVHSVLSGYLNHTAKSHKGVVNGLYIASYYMGGALGAWLPSFMYSAVGWSLYILSLIAMCCVGCYFSWRLMQQAHTTRL